tara:strand:- start:216 stop:398 length:183 start_codon:yes stop_codon:yes gene_type:complete
LYEEVENFKSIPKGNFLDASCKTYVLEIACCPNHDDPPGVGAGVKETFDFPLVLLILLAN